MPCILRKQGPVGCRQVFRNSALRSLFSLLLVLHVFADLFSVETNRVNTVAPRLEMIAPIRLVFEVSKLVKHPDRCSTLDGSHEFGN